MIFARLFKIIIYTAFAVNLVLLLTAISASYINPRDFWIPSLIGLFFRVFLLAHTGFCMIFLIGRLKWLSGISLAGLALCIPGIIHTFAFWPFGATNPASPSLKIMTYNVNDFSFFQDSLNIRSILNTINREQPDLVCFQEYSNQGKKARIIPGMLNMGYKFYYEYVTEELSGTALIGQAVFSRIPISNVHPIPFHNTTNGAFYVDFAVQKDTFRLFNVHFQSISLRENEMKIPASLQDFRPPQKYYYRMLFTKLRWAFRKRSFQAIKVREVIDSSPYKVIVCGDFNDTPLSFTYREMTENLKDTWLISNFGFGSTFGGRVRLQRIDYILTDPRIKTGKTRVLHMPGSDHYPVVARILLPAKN